MFTQQNSGIRLSAFLARVKQAIDSQHFSEWVIGEVQDLKCRNHVYFSLTDTDEGASAPRASLRCMIWAQQASFIIPLFEAQTSTHLVSGMKVLVHINLSFHELYGLSGVVDMIDASFTLGEKERIRRETIKRLQNEGYTEMQKRLSLPSVIRHIAVISSESAAGYGDFCNHIENNPYGLHIRITLFPSLMQGSNAPQSVINALGRSRDEMASLDNDDEAYDAVVIIRGGGSGNDLTYFDDYSLATYIATLPLPVITGIGHEQDTSVADYVAFQRAKTPTAAADFIISHNHKQQMLIEELRTSLRQIAMLRINNELNYTAGMQQMLRQTAMSYVDRLAMRSSSMRQMLSQALFNNINTTRQQVATLYRSLENVIAARTNAERQRTDMLLRQIEALNPKSIIDRGFSLSYNAKGHLIKSIHDIHQGESMTTMLADGNITSMVTNNN